MTFFNLPFHWVSLRPWPLLDSLRIFNIIFGIVDWFNGFNNLQNLLGVLCVLMVSFQWWRDVVREKTWQDSHTLKVFKGLQIGIILFIIREWFFFSFLWAFFHLRLSPDMEVGLIWPPKGIVFFNPNEIPLLNTIILLLSGFTITWSH